MATVNEKVSFGIKGAKLFPINGFNSTTGIPEYGIGIDWKGARGLTYKNTGESEATYADDELWILLEGAQGAEGEFTNYTLPREIKTKLMGYEEDTNKVLAKVNPATSFGFIYETSKIMENGTEDKVLHIIYNATLGAPEEEEATKEAKPTAKEYKIPYTAGSITNSKGQTFAKAEIVKSVVGDEIYNKAKNEIMIFGEATTTGGTK